jgi:hypothetical protein
MNRLADIKRECEKATGHAYDWRRLDDAVAGRSLLAATCCHSVGGIGGMAVQAVTTDRLGLQYVQFSQRRGYPALLHAVAGAEATVLQHLLESQWDRKTIC